MSSDLFAGRRCLCRSTELRYEGLKFTQAALAKTLFSFPAQFSMVSAVLAGGSAAGTKSNNRREFP